MLDPNSDNGLTLPTWVHDLEELIRNCPGLNSPWAHTKGLVSYSLWRLQARKTASGYISFFSSLTFMPTNKGLGCGHVTFSPPSRFQSWDWSEDMPNREYLTYRRLVSFFLDLDLQPQHYFSFFGGWRWRSKKERKRRYDRLVTVDQQQRFFFIFSWPLIHSAVTKRAPIHS